MFEDLDPDFLPSPGAALPMVAARVGAVRRRRAVVSSGVIGAVLFAWVVSTAFGNGGDPDRLTVTRKVTTTSGASSTTVKSLLTLPATSTSATSTTATSTTVPATVPTTTVATTTTRPTARLSVAFDRSALVIRGGSSATFAFTVRNDGDAPGRFGLATCPQDQVWPTEYSAVHPVLWPVPVTRRTYCAGVTPMTVGAHASRTVRLTVAAGLYDGASDNLVPAPPGHTSYAVDNGLVAGGTYRLPVTITEPAALPLTVDQPSEVTTASNAQNLVDFTITNHLPFAVRYVDQGPCSSDVGTPCIPTTSDKTPSGDLRRPPYDTAVKPLYHTRFLLDANETRDAQAQVNGTAGLANGSSGPALPPGVYHFDWDGEKIKFTVTP